MNDYAMWTGLSTGDFAILADDSLTSATDCSALTFQARGESVSPSANAYCSQDRPLLPMVDSQASREPILVSAEFPATDLLSLLQQQQQIMEADAALQEEHNIDAQIERLVQLKQAIHMQKHCQQQAQQTATGAGMPGTSSISLSAAPSLALSTASACSATMGLMDSQLFTGSNPLDLSNVWHASAAQPASHSTRHSLDIGALAHGFAGANISNSFTFGFNRPAVPAAEAGLQQQQGPTSSLLHSTFGSTPNLAAMHNPFMDAATAAPSSKTVSDIPLQSSGVLHLLSSLYAMPDPGASVGFQSWETPFAGLSTTPVAAAGNGGSRPAAPGSRDCVSMDLMLGATAWPAFTNASGAASGDATAHAAAQTQGLSAATASSAGSCSGQPTHRASLDVVPGLHVCRPPQKVRSSLAIGNSSSAGATRTSAAGPQQQEPLETAASAPAPAKGAIAQAPKWAGSHWHPMADVVKSGQLANKGTGVFIPGGLRSAA